ncbi:hypothetical protein [Hymenobacter cavernae]|uniref:ATP-grasp domain-containing protein n=1 Tax=Hymenobacter cavernae TaxID=2044852 RepID=A0ABQ1TU50_9BACT|nr:hypothetical protein [Hymenobacter cavernae]GGF03799.1 hypothetical protein GCM10011383_13570 [Hymenobacter cavernae]
MILVLSYDAYEQGTDPVISWLLHYEVPFVKVSLHDLINHRASYHIDLKNRDVVINGLSVRDTITTIWHRRFLGAGRTLSFPVGSHAEQLGFEIRTELQDLVSYLELLFRDKTWLTAFHQIKINKLELLDVASQCGLRVPHTQIINNRHDLLAFYLLLDGQLISKPIADVRGSYCHDDGSTYVLLTTTIDAARIAALPEHFFPSLFQEKVAVEFEIRVFYLDGRFFPTAMLLSGPERHIDKKLDSASERVHYVPYQLPPEIEEQLTRLMHSIGLNTGSIDLLKTLGGEYVFIEVNPVGQYLAESVFCHYALDKEIAEWLINHEPA